MIVTTNTMEKLALTQRLKDLQEYVMKESDVFYWYIFYVYISLQITGVLTSNNVHY